MSYHKNIFKKFRLDKYRKFQHFQIRILEFEKYRKNKSDNCIILTFMILINYCKEILCFNNLNINLF